MAVAGLRGTGDWGTDERPKNFREGILWYQPDGNSPIFALTSKAGKRGVNDPEFNWWSEGQTIKRLKVNGALGSGDTIVTVDGTDPSASAMGIPWGSANHLKRGDVLLVEPATDTAAYTQEHIEVVEVLGDTSFQVRRGVAGTSAASIADDQFLLLVGSAYAEGTGSPPATSRNPIKANNLTQIFKDSYELTGTAGQTEARTGNPWSNDKKRKSFDHAMSIEMAILFGHKYETTGDNGKPKRYMGGLREFIPSANTTIFSSAVTANSFLDALAPAFAKNTGAGDSRILFVGNQAAINLAKVFAAISNVHFNVSNVQKIYGMAFQEFVTPVGTVYIKRHPLLSDHDLYKKAGFLLDFDALKYVYLNGRDTKTMDDVQTKDEDLRRGLITTECSLEVHYGGLSMAYLGNISN